ncbi:MAG TPA: glycosyltransferase family 39 protein [Isosphaeraceae bacterium]
MSAPEPSAKIPAESPETPRRRLREAALIGLLALTLNLAGNGRYSLWDRDEPRYAGCTREMRASGDWIHPTFNAEPRYHKPILIYWLMLLGTALGGDNPFGARLVSALAGSATCLLVWGLGRRLFGPREGRLAALILATAPIWVAESKLATTDATLTLFLVACQFCLWELARAPSGRLAALFWIGLALAVLTKGPVGPVLIAAAGLLAWWWGGPSAGWRRLRWRWGVAGFLLLVAPWYIAIGVISHGEFYRVAMGYHVVRRMTTGIEQHGAFPGYYVLVSAVIFYPWSALLPPALAGAWSRRRQRPEFGFLLGWVVGPLIVLECVQTKLIHYYLPAYPACALLAAWLVGAVADDVANLRRWPLGRLGLGLLGGVGIGGVVALVAGGVVLPGSLRWPCLALAAVLGAGTLVAVERLQRGGTERAVLGLVGAWGVILLGVGTWLLPAAEPHRISRIVGQRLAAIAAREGARPVLGTFQESGVIYALGRPAPVFRTRDGLLEQLRAAGSVVCALMPQELAVLRGDPRFRVEFREVVRGFNVDKGRSEWLQVVVIRRGGSALAGLPQQAQVE